MLRDRVPSIHPYLAAALAAAGAVSLLFGARALFAPQTVIDHGVELRTIEVPTVVQLPAPAEVRPGVPGRMMACADSAALQVSDGAPAVCDGERKHCAVMTPGTFDAVVVAPEPPPVSWWAPEPILTDDKVCLGTTCKTLGPELAKRVESLGEEDRVDFTTDLEGAVVARRELWSVAKDRKIKLDAPTTTAPDPMQLFELHVAGNAVFSDWGNCAGPCTMMIVLDSHGRALGGGEGRGSFTQMDDHRFFYVGEWGEAGVFDMSGKQLASIELGRERGTEMGHPQVVRLDEDDVAVLTENPDASSSLTVLENYGGTSLSAGPTRVIPPCHSNR